VEVVAVLGTAGPLLAQLARTSSPALSTKLVLIEETGDIETR
jgi:hypothetical protein